MRKKEQEKTMLARVRGEVTPPNTPSKAGSERMSPGATARNRARLLEFHQGGVEKRGLPPSRLMEEIRKEERTMSPGSSPRLKPAWRKRGEVVGTLLGRDLREELERLGAEAQHQPPTTPAVVVREEEKQE